MASTASSGLQRPLPTSAAASCDGLSLQRHRHPEAASSTAAAAAAAMKRSVGGGSENGLAAAVQREQDAATVTAGYVCFYSS